MTGNYSVAPPLANITIAGASCLPTDLSLTIGGHPCEVEAVHLDHRHGVLYVSGIEPFTPSGAWEGAMEMKLTF